MLVRADAAEGVDGDGGGGAVVDDEGGAGRWRTGRVAGVRSLGVWRVGWAADAQGEVGGVGACFRADLDRAAGVWF